MSRNITGNIIENFLNLPEEKKKEYAEMFSEGDEDLKRLLIKMWNNGIQTYASCAGHDDDMGNEDPYIFFDIKTLSEKQQRMFYKILIIACKKLEGFKRFEVEPDLHMGFERHGLTIRLRKGKNAYAILNEIFDSVMNTSLSKNLKEFFEQNNFEAKFTEKEKKFVDSLIQLNSISLDELSLAKTSPEQKIKEFMLEYEDENNMFMSIIDGINISWFEFGRYSTLDVAEGYYTEYKYRKYTYTFKNGEFVENDDEEYESLYYTLKNGEAVLLDKNELGGLKNIVEDRIFNFKSKFDYEKFNEIKAEIDSIVSNKIDLSL